MSENFFLHEFFSFSNPFLNGYLLVKLLHLSIAIFSLDLLFENIKNQKLVGKNFLLLVVSANCICFMASPDAWPHHTWQR